MSHSSSTASPYKDLFALETETPNHYELLGLAVFTENLDQIDAAASARLRRLQDPREGLPLEICKKIAREIQDAKECLGQPSTKAAYDLQLRREMVMAPQTRGGNSVLPRQPESHISSFAGQETPELVEGTSSATGNNDSNTQPHPPLPAESGDSTSRQHDVVENGRDDILRDHPKYESIRLIAEGRCNKVFEAYETTLRRKVAIKQLNSDASDRQAALFWREAQFLAVRGHQNVVTIHGCDERRGWIIMERMTGDLESRIAQGPMDPDLVRAVLRQALEGLGHFRRQDRIHGEIKPANLLVDGDGYVKLNASPGFQTNDEFRTPLGSQRHVAPELLAPKVFGELGPAADLYCLGFTVLELLVGPGIENLFKGIGGDGKQRDLAWLRWHNSHTETLPSVRHLVPDAPDDLVAVIDRLMAKKVSQRFQCVEEAQQALENAPLLRIPLEEGAHIGDRTKRGPGAIIKGKPPAHQEHAEQKEKEKSLLYQITHSPVVDPIRIYLERLNTAQILIFAVIILLVCFLLWKAMSGPTKALVRFESDPPGAVISINGTALGRQTPWEGQLFAGKTYTVTFELDGYKQGQLSVEIPAEGEAGPFVCALEPLEEEHEYGSVPVVDSHMEHVVTIDSSPSGAEIILEGEPIPIPGENSSLQTRGRLDLRAGSYRLGLRAEGYLPVEETIEVAADRSNCFFFELELEPPEPEPKSESNEPGSTELIDSDSDSDGGGGELGGPGSPFPQPKPKPPGPVTPVVSTPIVWGLPEFIDEEAKKQYFREACTIFDCSWNQSPLKGCAIAGAASARAQFIYSGDPVLHFACGIVLHKHNRIEAARRQLEMAKEFECTRHREFEEAYAENVGMDFVPFTSPWRQLARTYLAQEQWDLAVNECVELIRYCARTQERVERLGASGVSSESTELTYAILQENVRFVGHAFGYMVYRRSGLAHADVQPLDRFERLLLMMLDEDYGRLLHDAVAEAWAYCDKNPMLEDPIQGQSKAEDWSKLTGNPLEDLLLSLDWERQLLLQAISEKR